MKKSLFFNRAKKLNRQRGIILIMMVFLIGVIFTYAWLITAELMNVMVVTTNERWRVQAASFSRLTFHDLSDAVKTYLQKVGIAMQVVLNKSNPKGGGSDLSVDGLDQLCKQTFPRYFHLELRGKTIAPVVDDAPPPTGFWDRLYGKATVQVKYDGILPASDVGLPDDTTGKRLNYVIALTATVPYDIEVHNAPIPEDGDGSAILNSAWRPTIPVTTWTNTKKGFKALSKSGGLYVMPSYSSAGEMKCYIAFSVPVSEPPPDLTDSTLTPSCTSQALAGCGGVNYDGSCSHYVVFDSCTGQNYSGVFRDQNVANDVANALNNNRGAVAGILETNKFSFSSTPVGTKEKLTTDYFGNGFYAPPPPYFWAKMLPPGIDPTVPGPPSGGTKPISKIAPTSNLNDARIMFGEMVPLAPGKYVLKN
ncbi:MAG: hypothetical protein K1Y36_24525 [Blastocatellia bacterium]|nr:hypothetical protein [Blastocatellia bacterium]